MLGSRFEPLSQLEVLVVDCQATAAAPRGHLLEIGWAQVRNTVTRPHACPDRAPGWRADSASCYANHRTPEFVQASLEWLALRAAFARRRAIWLTRLVDSSVVWREPGDSCTRLIVIERGEVALSAAVDANAPPPIPPGYRRPVAARREAFTVASFDRLRVLTTELKRVIAAGAPVALRLGVGPALDQSRLASALWWV